MCFFVDNKLYSRAWNPHLQQYVDPEMSGDIIAVVTFYSFAM